MKRFWKSCGIRSKFVELLLVVLARVFFFLREAFFCIDYGIYCTIKLTIIHVIITGQELIKPFCFFLKFNMLTVCTFKEVCFVCVRLIISCAVAFVKYIQIRAQPEVRVLALLFKMICSAQTINAIVTNNWRQPVVLINLLFIFKNCNRISFVLTWNIQWAHLHFGTQHHHFGWHHREFRIEHWC